MKTNKNKIASIFMASAILSSTITPTVLAVENTDTEMINQVESETKAQNILVTKDNELKEIQVKGTFEKNTEYEIIIGETFRKAFHTDAYGTFTIVLAETAELNLENHFKIISTTNEVMFDGSLIDFYVEDKDQELLPPDLDIFDTSEGMLLGYNHNGEVLVVNINDKTILTYDISVEDVFSLHIEDEIQSGDVLSVYVENGEGNRSESVELVITDSTVIPNTEAMTEFNEDPDEVSKEVLEQDISGQEEITQYDSKEPVINSILEVSTSSSVLNTQLSEPDSLNGIDIEKEPLGKKYHFVQPNETLYSLAKAYNTTVDYLTLWNSMTDASQLIAGSLLSVDGVYNYDNITSETKVFSSNQDFLNYITPQAKIIAKEYNLYTSVMIAQALHESNWGRSRLAKLGNNLFGVKGSYEGNSIVMLTWEEKPDGEIIWIQDSFRLYPTFYESIVDNAIKLRYGLSWNKNFYSGTWVENTASHMDSTDWLTGRYATDSRYDSKVNNTIKYNSLLQYDEHISITNPISSQHYLNRVAYLNNVSTPIYTQPYGTASFKQVSQASSHVGKLLTIKQEKVNDLGKWYSLRDGSTDIGWINETAIKEMYYDVITISPSKYSGTLIKPWSINSNPWGTVNAKKVVDDGFYVGRSVNVLEEKTTDNAVYALISINGIEIGWVDNSAIEKNTEVIATYDRYYGAQVTAPVTVYSAPYGTTGSEIIATDSYAREMITVTKEKETKHGTYSLININSKEIGWVAKNSLTKAEVLFSKKVNYSSTIHESTNVYSHPWGLDDFKLVSTTEKQVDSVLTVIEEKVTQFGDYALIHSGDIPLGWVEKNKLDLHPILETQQSNYKAIVKEPWSINTLPWGTFGYRTVDNGDRYIGQTVDVVEEKTTPRSVYALIRNNGKTLGWIDTTGIEKITVSSTTNQTYGADITKPWSINSAPWGTNNAEFLYDGSNFIGDEVVVKQEKTTQRGTYALVESNGKELGWIDTTGIKPHSILSEKNVNYVATITKPWSVNTEPWGIKGFENVISDSRLVGKTINVLKEIETPRSSYLLLEQNGTILGWIDETGVQKDYSVSKHTDIQFSATISQPWSINSKPYGSDGYERVAEGKDYVNKEVTVVAEQVTDRSTYALIQYNGIDIGWIDSTGIIPHNMISEKQTNYLAVVIKPWSINSLPWGIRGYEQVDTGVNFLNKEVRILAEQKTSRSTYMLIEHNGTEIGWIDSTGIRKK